MPADNRLKILLAVIAVAVATIFSLAPIAQAPSYHHFADQRRMLHIANFYNVLSSLPFVIVGAMGMRLVAHGHASGGLAELRPLYFTFFAGVFLTGFGSAYYHYQPNNQTLLWDRLPMTMVFMAFFCAIVGDHISPRLARQVFVPLLLLGAASVIYWQLTELNGHGDLRAYALVQFLPVLLIPLILWLFDSTLNNDGYIWGIIGAYGVSKVLELLDATIYSALGLISGHSLKHLTAALGAFIFYQALRKRR